MEKEFIPYEQALALKELGFNELLNYYYDSFGDIGSSNVKVNWNESEELLCSAPTYSQAFRWFRNKYKLPSHITTYWQHDWNNYSYQYYFVQDKVEWNGIEHYKTYKEAELACLRKLIDIVKEKHK